MSTAPLLCPNASFFGTKLDRYLTSRRARSLDNLLLPRKTILDIGCGQEVPVFHHFNPDFFLKYVGIDQSVPTATLASNAQTVQVNLETSPLKLGTFDYVVCLAVIEHLHQPDVFIKRVKTVLKKKGTLILTTPTPRAKPMLEFLAFRLRLISTSSIKDHKRYFNPRTLQRLLEKNGFKITSHHRFQFGFNQLVQAKHRE